MSGGLGGAQPPPICKTSNTMRTCRFLLSLARGFARTCRFLLSAARSCLRMRCYKYERGGLGGVGEGAAPPSCKTSNRMAKHYFLLSLAEICCSEAARKKKERGGWGGRSPPPFFKTSSKMRAKKYRHVVSCSALLGLACECGAINMSGGVGGGAAPPICKTSSKMRTCRFLLSLARFCENMSFLAQRC